jgi:HAD superfamily hydrolase (TIGR01459 family)
MLPRQFPGLRAIADQYEAFILDLWGVVHDGQAAFPHSAEALRRLKAAGRKTLLLSNAPRRPYALAEQLESFGIPPDLYDGILSSGEAVRSALIARDDPFFAALGDRAYHLGPERDRSVFDDVPVRLVDTLEDADFVVNTGPRDLADTVEDYADTLTAMAGRGLPMVCANPDLVVIRAGKTVVCAGALAARYADLGGVVVQRGKPDPAIYALAVRQMDSTPCRVCVIGDSLETDMRGAQAAGLTGIWVTGGIHAADLDAAYGKPPDMARVEALCRDHGLWPTGLLPGFIW